MSRRFKVGYQIHPQHCTPGQIRQAYRGADALGVDSLWTWDHMYPLYGDPEGDHYACTPLLAAMAVETTHASIGSLVNSNSYRNPEFLAYETATIDHLSGGRAVLGIGAGWFERDYQEYGYEFGDAPSRLRQLGQALPRIRERLGKLNPRPSGGLPIMVGGGGEKVTLRLTAEHADMWNTFPPAENWSRKNRVLTEWCERLGRDPAQVERTVGLNPNAMAELPGVLEAGCQHVILLGVAPFDLGLLENLLKQAES